MKSVFHSALSLSLLAALSCTIATVRAATPTADHIVLGLDWNAPTRCSDNNADSLSISEAKIGSTVWGAVQASGLYNWGFFGSSMANPPGTKGGVPFYEAFPTMRRWYRYGDGSNQSATDRAPYNPPNPNYDYWIGSVGLCTPNDGSVDSHFSANHVYKFEGRSLTIDGTITHCSKGTSICDFGENVIIKSGQYTFPALGAGRPCSRGKATVSGTAFKFAAGTGMTTRSACYLDWSMSGAPESQFSFTHAATQTATWWWCGDCSAYYGRCVVSSANATASNYSILAISNSVFNGTIEVQKFERLQSFGDDAFIARAEIAEDATLDVASGHTTRIGTLVLDGKMNFTASNSRLGLTEGMSFGPWATVSLAEKINGKIITMPSSAAFDAETFLAAVQRGNGAARTIAAKVVDNGDGTKSVVVSNPGAVANGTLTVDDDLSVAGGDAKYRVSVVEGKTLDLINGAERMAINIEDDATVNIRRAFDDWSTIPSLWLDASAANTVSNLWVEEGTLNEGAAADVLKGQYVVTRQNKFPLVNQWCDCRADQQTVKFWSDRYDQTGKVGPDGTVIHYIYAHTHPWVVTGGLNGKNYISFGNKPGGSANEGVDLEKTDGTTISKGTGKMQRGYFYQHSSTTQGSGKTSPKPYYAFLVFGMQNEGGNAVLVNKALGRGGAAASCPITTNASEKISAWIDGVSVSPTASNTLKPAWQVLTLKLSGAFAIDGLGYCANASGDNGGQNYAEIIFVDRELSERQRQTIEVYLAEKWGLKDQYDYPSWAKDPFATVYGAGTVKLEANATLGGAFKGTVDLNGNNLVIDGTALPPTDAAIDTENLEGWYDPDLAGRYTEGVATIGYDLAAGGRTNVVQMPSPRMLNLWDRLRTWKAGDYLIYGQPQRAPWLDKSARAFGPARNWMVFENQQDPLPSGLISGNIANGKVLRFSKIVNETTGAGDGGTYQQPMQTLFMVQDSVNGGGHPFADGVNVNSPVLYKQRIGAASAVGQPIYPSGSDGILTQGLTCIDGREVDGTTESFGARPEVLTVVPTNTFNMVAIGQLSNSENVINGHHEVIGEIMIYNRKLEAAERKVVEAYLSYKWLGIANAGYSALTDATVTGAGKVTAASAALLPKFAAGFTGTVSVPLDDGLAFTLATVDQATTVEGALDFGGGALEVPAGVTTLTVSVAASGAKPRSGSYKLIGWAAKPAVTWNLSLDGWTREQCALRVADDGLYLDLERLGMTVIVR